MKTSFLQNIQDPNGPNEVWKAPPPLLPASSQLRRRREWPEAHGIRWSAIALIRLPGTPSPTDRACRQTHKCQLQEQLKQLNQTFFATRLIDFMRTVTSSLALCNSLREMRTIHFLGAKPARHAKFPKSRAVFDEKRLILTVSTTKH